MSWMAIKQQRQSGRVINDTVTAAGEGGGSGIDDERGGFNQLATQSSDVTLLLKTEMKEKIGLEEFVGAWCCGPSKAAPGARVTRSSKHKVARATYVKDYLMMAAEEISVAGEIECETVVRGVSRQARLL